MRFIGLIKRFIITKKQELKDAIILISIIMTAVLMALGLVLMLIYHKETGTLAEWAGAFATLVAVFVSLYLANVPKKQNIKLFSTVTLNYAPNDLKKQGMVVPDLMKLKIDGFNYGDLGDAVKSIELFDWSFSYPRLLYSFDAPTKVAPNDFISINHDVTFDKHPSLFFQKGFKDIDLKMIKQCDGDIDTVYFENFESTIRVLFYSGAKKVEKVTIKSTCNMIPSELKVAKK